MGSRRGVGSRERTKTVHRAWKRWRSGFSRKTQTGRCVLARVVGRLEAGGVDHVAGSQDDALLDAP
ncbi:MAG: hypothetical protein WCR07_02525 [Verrucomicrobiota bacterium]